jgi:hypothetical protein
VLRGASVGALPFGSTLPAYETEELARPGALADTVTVTPPEGCLGIHVVEYTPMPGFVSVNGNGASPFEKVAVNWPFATIPPQSFSSCTANGAGLSADTEKPLTSPIRAGTTCEGVHVPDEGITMRVVLIVLTAALAPA